MLSQVFTSPDKSFSIELPKSWEQYDSEEKGTYAFYNPTINLTGNLRITAIHGKKEGADLSADIKEMQLRKHKEARFLKLGSLDVLTYTFDAKQENTPLVIYNWVTGNKELALICSFTIEKKDQKTAEMLNELKTVENIISSIKIL